VNQFDAESKAIGYKKRIQQADCCRQIFWGLWLFPLALLVYGSRFLPRFLGVWPALGGFAWVILSLTGVLLPQYQDKVFTYSQPAAAHPSFRTERADLFFPLRSCALFSIPHAFAG